MAKVQLTFDAIREFGLTLPNVVESTVHGLRSLKMHGRLLACEPVHKSAEPNCAVIMIDFDRRATLLKAHPDIYYITDHYADYPSVLVRLSRISPKELRDLLGLAQHFLSSKKPARSTRTNARRTARGPRRERPVTGKSGPRGQ